MSPKCEGARRLRLHPVPVLALALVASSRLHAASAERRPALNAPSSPEAAASNPLRNAPDAAHVLATLRKSHPRLILLPEDVERAKRLAETDLLARRYRDHLYKEGEALLTAPPVVHQLEGPRLLTQSRRALSRVTTLATLYRLDHDRRWLDRARVELFAAAAFPDWNPSHFLDTAEMTHAFALGYDWLYDAWTPEERSTLRKAIVEKGLRRGEEAYRGEKPWKWWVTAHHNWNQVCNGGMILGALAVADEEPELAGFIVASALKSLPLAMESFAPDGGWNEGPGYWAYTTDYTVALIAGLRTALGDDFGLRRFPGFDRTGLFRIQFVGPTGKTFNYADAGDGAGGAPQMRPMADWFQQPLYPWEANRATKDGSALDLLWYRPTTAHPAADAPLDAFFQGVDVAFFRSQWEDPNALWVGFKGGDNAANHSHLDLGDFVMDALGERWALDLGGDNYNLPGYFGKERWSYYRLRTEGQNTLLLNGVNQGLKAKAPITAFLSRPDHAFAVADLSAAYAPAATRVRRGIALVEGRRAVLIQDEVTADAPVEVVSAFHTRAEVTADGAMAHLTLNGKRLNARILEPEGATFAVESTKPPAPQNPNDGVRKLVTRLPDKVKEARIAVLLSPVWPDGGDVKTMPIRPLGEWIKEDDSKERKKP